MPYSNSKQAVSKKVGARAPPLTVAAGHLRRPWLDVDNHAQNLDPVDRLALQNVGVVDAVQRAQPVYVSREQLHVALFGHRWNGMRQENRRETVRVSLDY